MKKIYGMLTLLTISSIVYGTEFSADFLMKAGGISTSGRMFFGQNKFRMDMNVPQKITTITLLDKKEVINIMHEQKIYMVMPFDPQNKPKVEERLEGEIERKKVGTEVIDGHPTIKYLITCKTNNEKQEFYQWFADDIKLPLKIEARDGSWSQEFKNVKMGKVPDSVFEIPAGYRKVEIPIVPRGGINLPVQP